MACSCLRKRTDFACCCPIGLTSSYAVYFKFPMSRKYDFLFKLLLIGDSGVGKTSIIHRLPKLSESDPLQCIIQSELCSELPTTVFLQLIVGIDFKIKTVELKGKKIKLQIWDTAGQERFHTITTSYYRGAMGIMLVYDVSDGRSFENIAKWLRNIELRLTMLGAAKAREVQELHVRSVTPTSFMAPTCAAIHKLQPFGVSRLCKHASEDVERVLLANKCDMADQRVVSSESGENIAREHGIKFFETSAKSNVNIQNAFYYLTEAILDKAYLKMSDKADAVSPSI
ncbi:unnamed protein product [Toxocara canis]|uniref:Ras-related protein Rab-10 n=1 Tax=Toxocara canis TaxID=6265 RepID=A0A183UIN3_TOXCA|nr:unnamed protein product [Toxocara canis]